ncbi:hypothetical protein Tco_0410511 [Tanacetum coccineum]
MSSSSSTSSSNAIVTYTSISSDMPSWAIPLMDAYEPKAPKAAPHSHDQAPLSPVPAPEYPEYLAPSDDDIPAEDQPLHVDASPTARSSGYIADSKPIEDDFEEDPEEDPADYPFKEEEEDPLAPADSASPVLDFVPSSEETEQLKEVRPQPPLLASTKALIAEYGFVPTSPSPPLSLLSPLSSPLPNIPSPPLLLPLPARREIIPEVDMPPQKRVRFAAPSHMFEILSSVAAAARQSMSALTRGTELDFMTALEEVKRSVTDITAMHRQDSEEFCTHYQDAQDDKALLQARISTLSRERLRLECYRLRPDHWREMSVCYSGRGWMTVTGLVQWFEKIEFVFHINKCTVECQVKFATCTLLGGVLTWWNSHVRTVGHDFAYALPWKTLMKMTVDPNRIDL